MVVVEQLSAEFQIELAAELIDAVADMLGLKRDVLVVVEPDAHGIPLLLRTVLLLH